MSTAFGIESNCINEPNNEYRTQGKKILKRNPIGVALFLFAPQILKFFSILITYRSITKFYMKMFRENVEHRKAHETVRHDFVNLLMQLMDKGYIDDDHDKTDKG
jgi:cytochrome P450 family 6